MGNTVLEPSTLMTAGSRELSSAVFSPHPLSTVATAMTERILFKGKASESKNRRAF
jgi:hypothetical protein